MKEQSLQTPELLRLAFDIKKFQVFRLLLKKLQKDKSRRAATFFLPSLSTFSTDSIKNE